MLETYFSSGHVITKAVGHFPSLKISPALSSHSMSAEIGAGFSLLSKRHQFSQQYAKFQKDIGYSGKGSNFIAYNFGAEVKNEFFDDPFQKFLKLGIAISLIKPFKVSPQGYTVLNDARASPAFYRPRNFLAADDFNTLSLEKRPISLQALKSAVRIYERMIRVASEAANSRIDDALTYYGDYLRETDPKLELVILTMILEVLFIEDNVTMELQTKLATRLSRYLYPRKIELVERADFCEFMKTIYNLRSRVLHGADYQGDVAAKAKKASVTPKQYMSAHIARLDKVVMAVIKSILQKDETLTLMMHPRKKSDDALRTMYQNLLLG